MRRLHLLLLLVTAALPPAQARALQSGEYYLDTDPGPGLGTAFYSGAAQNWAGTITLPPQLLASLPAGLHDLGIRFRDADSEWGPAIVQRFEVQPLTAPQLATAEYFLNNDPGTGVGVALPVAAEPDYAATLELPATFLRTLPDGLNTLALRFRDAHGDWGQDQSITFVNPTDRSAIVDRVEWSFYQAGQILLSGVTPGDAGMTFDETMLAQGLNLAAGTNITAVFSAADGEGNLSPRACQQFYVVHSGQFFQASAALSDDLSSGISTARTYTHAISGGGAVTINGVPFLELNPALTPPGFLWDAGGNSKDEVNPVTNGDWNPALGGVTGAGLLSLLGGFTHSASGNNPGAVQTFTLSGLTTGQTYDCRIYTRAWDTEGSGRPVELTFINGTASAVVSPLGGLLQDRVPTFLAGGGQHQACFLNFRYTAQSPSLTIRAAIPSGAPAASGSFHFYGLSNEVVPDTYSLWATAAGLTGTAAQLHATPRGDGVANLLKYAFNMNPAGPDTRTLTPGTGTAGLPAISLTGSPSARILRVEFLRRKGSGLTYNTRKTTSVNANPWQPLTDTPTVTSMDATWERVVYEEPVTGARWFARVEVALP